jgi:ribulose kinase
LPPADAFAGMLGLGAVKPDRLALITGSSHVLLGQSKEEFHRKSVFGAFPDAVIPGLCAVEGSQISTDSVLKWFKDQFIGHEYERQAEKEGLNLYDYLRGLARQIKIGSDGLILLNYWQGNRNPVTDSEVRGVVWGFSLKHSAAHLYRAIMEGIAYGTEYILRQFKDAGFEPDGIYVCGGATNSDLWMQIHADVMGLPIVTTSTGTSRPIGVCATSCTTCSTMKPLDVTSQLRSDFLYCCRLPEALRCPWHCHQAGTSSPDSLKIRTLSSGR